MEKINIAELLKDCPKGMELDCTMFENVTFEGIKQGEYPITVKIKKPSVYLRLTKNGCWNSYNSAKCVIFPKGETTWEGFVPPYKFKDGDVLVHTQNDRFIMSIYKSNKNEQLINTHAILWDREEGLSVGMQICCYTDNVRLATEEEKEKLFDAIKANGYKWNEETKTLEKLPKFKVGDKITKIDGSRKGEIYYIDIDKYHVAVSNNIGIDVFFEDQDDWELVFDIEPKFKVGDRIVKKDNPTECWYVQGVNTNCNLDYFYYIVAKGKIANLHFKEQDDYELVPNKFDITTLKPFQKVLVRDSVNLSRDSDKEYWSINLFGFYNEITKQYCCMGNTDIGWDECIPYEGNEHLLGTTADCDEYFKNW